VQATSSKAPTLGEVFKDEGLMTGEDLNQAREHHRATGKSLVQSIHDLGFVSEEVKFELLRSKFGIESIDLSTQAVNQKLLNLIPRREAVRHQAVPVVLDNDKLIVAMEEPQNHLVVAYMKTLSGYDVFPRAARGVEIQAALEQYPSEDNRIDLQEYGTFTLIIAKILFFVLYFFPIAVFGYVVGTESISFENFKTWLASLAPFEVGLFLFITWGIWALIIFEVTGLLFKPKQEPPKIIIDD
jgi:hypothetical protein